jgi:hypothetical protein
MNDQEALQAERDALWWRNKELEQQLAETREELRIALAQRQDYRAEATQARALLEWWLFYASLPYTASADVDEKLGLTRAFLAQHKEASDGK